MNSYDKHQLTARDFEREDIPPVLWLCAGVIGILAGVFMLAALLSAF